jgi:hypothetical protein
MTKENTRFYELKNEIHELRKKDLNKSLSVQAELNRMEDWSKIEFDIFHFDDEIAILTRGGKYYGLNHRDMNKAELRDYANEESVVYVTEKNEDGGVDFYYDDDSWEVDCEVIEGYIKNYVDKEFTIADDGDAVEYGDGQIFHIKEGDNGWMELVQNLLNWRSNGFTYTHIK